MTTTITVISDTHCQKWEEVHSTIKKEIAQSNISAHCGDIIKQDVVDGFLQTAQNAILVHGNSDPKHPSGRRSYWNHTSCRGRA